jgi:hypothetical protein
MDLISLLLRPRIIPLTRGTGRSSNDGQFCRCYVLSKDLFTPLCCLALLIACFLFDLKFGTVCLLRLFQLLLGSEGKDVVVENINRNSICSDSHPLNNETNVRWLAMDTQRRLDLQEQILSFYIQYSLDATF